MRERIKLILCGLSLLFANNIFAQNGSITGNILEQSTGEGLIGATVSIEGTTKGTITDFNGDYTLANVEPGTYTVLFSFVSFTTQRQTEIEVKAGEAVVINVTMEEATTALDEVKVVGKANRESEAMLLVEQKNAVLAVQSIGAKELSRKGVSDAEGAVSKVSGISKQEGAKNVFVRGLGDRYNSTKLNGFPVPSEDPEYKNISLDFFGSDMIQSVGVNKVFSADMNGDVGGAAIDILSKELVKSSELEIGITTGINSSTLGEDFCLTEGSNGFGYANTSDGPESKVIGGRDVISDYGFDNSLKPSIVNSTLNRGISLSGGKKFSGSHSFFLVGSYGTDFNIENGNSRNTTTASDVPYQDFEYTKSSQSSEHMLLGNLNLSFEKHNIKYNALYIHTNNTYYTEYFGTHTETFQKYDDLGSKGYVIRQQIDDNSIFVNQLIWKWDVTSRIKADIGAALNNVEGNQPDRRVNNLSLSGDETLELTTGDSRQQRFYNTLTENDFNVRAKFSFRLFEDEDNKSMVQFGYTSRFANKEFVAPIYNMDWNLSNSSLPTFSVNDFDLNAVYNKDAYANDYFTIENYFDTYNVNKYTNGAYASLTYQLQPNLIVNAGIRVDQVFIDIEYDVNKAGLKTPDPVIDSMFFMPSLNIKYDVNEKNSVRFGLSQTYTLPQDKEIAPFVNVQVGQSSSGNPYLTPSKNLNFDLKWDYYISRSEILTLNGFYKYIVDPIARVDQGNSAGLLTYDNISDHATAMGLEIEFRKSVFNKTVGTGKHDLNFGLNGSVIETELELDGDKIRDEDRTTSLEGAAPFIVNMDLTYIMKYDRASMTNSIVFNYISDKVHTIGTTGYQDIIEEGIPTLDFISSTSINDHWKVNLKLKNLLNPTYKLSRETNGDETVTLSEFNKGISIGLGVTYKF